jgi:hypothetical protein
MLEQGSEMKEPIYLGIITLIEAVVPKDESDFLRVGILKAPDIKLTYENEKRTLFTASTLESILSNLFINLIALYDATF